jgi:hypothetical protein
VAVVGNNILFTFTAPMLVEFTVVALTVVVSITGLVIDVVKLAVVPATGPVNVQPVNGQNDEPLFDNALMNVRTSTIVTTAEEDVVISYKGMLLESANPLWLT